MTSNNPYSIFESEDEYSHTDMAPFYTQSQAMSTSLDPILGADETMFPSEQPTMQRFLREHSIPRFWQASHWPDDFSMAMSSYSATPTLESNGRSSSPGSPRLSFIPPNACRSIAQASFQQHGEPPRPLTPLASSIATSAPGAFSEQELPTPPFVLEGLGSPYEPQERTANTIHVRPAGHAPSSLVASLAPAGSPPLPLKEQNPTKDVPETIQPAVLLSPPMEPHPLPKDFTRPQRRPNAASSPKPSGRDRKPKQAEAKNTSSANRVTKPRQRAAWSSSSPARGSVKLNVTRNQASDKFPPITQEPAPEPANRSCKECHFSCSDRATLDKHIKSKHSGRPFICVFRFAGCPAVFAFKNEWKRHVLSQHIVPKVYNCTLDGCGRAKGRSQTTYLEMRGKQFNRKDLFDSHMKRMHPQLATKKLSPREWEQTRQALLEESTYERCELPARMECPNPGCTQTFQGEDAWDHRMEHMACHMEKAAKGEAREVLIGGDNDRTLLDWASSPEVGVIRRSSSGGWKLCYPSKDKMPTLYRRFN